MGRAGGGRHGSSAVPRENQGRRQAGLPFAQRHVMRTAAASPSHTTSSESFPNWCHCGDLQKEDPTSRSSGRRESKPLSWLETKRYSPNAQTSSTSHSWNRGLSCWDCQMQKDRAPGTRGHPDNWEGKVKAPRACTEMCLPRQGIPNANFPPQCHRKATFPINPRGGGCQNARAKRPQRRVSRPHEAFPSSLKPKCAFPQSHTSVGRLHPHLQLDLQATRVPLAVTSSRTARPAAELKAETCSW